MRANAGMWRSPYVRRSSDPRVIEMHVTTPSGDSHTVRPQRSTDGRARYASAHNVRSSSSTRSTSSKEASASPRRCALGRRPCQHVEPHELQRAPAGRGTDRLRRTRRSAADRRGPRGVWIRPAVQHPDRGDPGGDDRSRRVRPRQDGLRQDARLRRADAGAHHRRRRAVQAPRARARADPRTRGAGRRGVAAGRASTPA